MIKKLTLFENPILRKEVPYERTITGEKLEEQADDARDKRRNVRITLARTTEILKQRRCKRNRSRAGSGSGCSGT